MDRVRVRTKAKYHRRRIVVALLLIAIIAGVIYTTVKLAGYTAETTLGSIKVSETYDAVIIRDETAFTTLNYTRADYLVTEGSFVQSGTPVMEVYKRGYNDGMGANYQQISEEVYNAQLESLGDTRDETLINFNDLISEAEANVASAAMLGDEAGVIAYEKELQKLMELRNSYLKSVTQPTEKLQSLYERERLAKENLGGWVVELAAQRSGNISFYFDGYENALNKDKLSIITADVVSGAIKKRTAAQWATSEENLAYRIVNTSEWYCAFLTATDEPLRLTEGRTYRIEVEGFGEYEAAAEKVVISGKNIVNVLKVEAEIGELIGVRNVKLKVDYEASGVKVETRSLLNLVDGQYIDIESDGTQQRVEINVLACDGNYAIIEGNNKNLDGGIKYWVPKAKLIKYLKGLF